MKDIKTMYGREKYNAFNGNSSFENKKMKRRTTMENYELTTNEEINETQEIEACGCQETSGKKTGGILLTVLTAAAAGVAVWAYKTKDKREAKKIEKLRQKGYVIYKEENVEPSDVEVEEVE